MPNPNEFTFVTISEHLGANVHIVEIEADDLERHDGDALEAAKEGHGYNDADAIFSVYDARELAGYILENTPFADGGMDSLITDMDAALANGEPEAIVNAWAHLRRALVQA